MRERRKYVRFDTEVKINFHVSYLLKTKVRFQLENGGKILPPKYPALSRNISVEGLGFSSDKKLKDGDCLYMEVYLPGQAKPVYMEGKVCWSRRTLGKERYKYNTGIKLITVSGKPVRASIYYDKKYKVIWSAVLDSVFGSFRKTMQKNRKRRM